MTVKGYVCTLIAAGAMTAMLPQLGQAAQFRTDKIQIDRQFKVNNTVLPAGEYRLEESSDSAICNLVNVKTGASIMLIRPASVRQPGKVAFVFHETAEGITLSIA